MNYYLFKLKFETAVHFGDSDSALSLYTSADHFCADTLFSALCHTANALQGQEGVIRLCRQAAAGELALSDSMPWRENRLYLPKPYMTAESRQEIPAALRKKMKRLSWIPVDTFGAFADSIHGGQLYQPEEKAGFGTHSEQTKVNLTGEQAVPYQVGLFQFDEDCGLYLIAGCQNEEQFENLEKLLRGLGISGIGGKVSAGYGRFSIVQAVPLHEAADLQLQWLNEALRRESAPRYLLLTTSLPSDSELDSVMAGASYQLLRRGGFANGNDATPNHLKKQTQYYLAAGSVLPNRFKGQLFDVGGSEHHPVYRYSIPILLGVFL